MTYGCARDGRVVRVTRVLLSGANRPRSVPRTVSRGVRAIGPVAGRRLIVGSGGVGTARGSASFAVDVVAGAAVAAVTATGGTRSRFGRARSVPS